MKSILIADDHSIVIMGLISILEKSCPNAKIDIARNGIEIQELVKQKDYELMILDIKMPDFESIEFVKSVVVKSPTTIIIILSGFAGSLFRNKYLAAGATLYLEKNNSPNEIKEAIALVTQENYSKPEFVQQKQNKKNTNLSPFAKLSQQEIIVVQYLVQGISTSEIAHKMDAKASTISTYKKRLFDKLGISTLVDLLNLVDIYDMPTNDSN